MRTAYARSFCDTAKKRGTTALTGFVFYMMRFISEAANYFCQRVGCFGICANGAFEENLEMEMIYF
jgi:hypothetical protein